ncbi:MAG TPA: hypothetical protein VMI73_12680 [Trebonia sp.]|nr:hypothetical protein [Trebonia sp.]
MISAAVATATSPLWFATRATGLIALVPPAAGARAPAGGAAGGGPQAGRVPGAGGALVSKRLRVNPILREAHGVCARLLPELITLDPWGYPVLAKEPVPPELLPLARRATAASPALALLLERAD